VNKPPVNQDATPVTQLGIFAKFWEPGKVKTRLGASIGNEPAAALHHANVATLVGRMGTEADRCVLAISPWEQRGAFEELVQRRCERADMWQIEPQPTGDLGARMQQYFDEAFAHGCERVVLIGSDSPTIPSQIIRGAFESLTSNDVVLGPAEDGGYYLVGARGKAPSIFDGVDWGTERVWDQTMQHITAGDLSLGKVAIGYDVDRIDDLRRLQTELTESEFDAPLWAELKQAVDDAMR